VEGNEVSVEKRDYNEELVVLLRIAKENSFLVPSSFTNYLEVGQAAAPVVHWIDSRTSSKEVEDANT
jgi:hypothetical protein